MGWVAPAIMAGGSLLGGMMGGKNARAANRPQYQSNTSSSTPWGPVQGDVGNILDFSRYLFGNYTPRAFGRKPPDFEVSPEHGGLLDYLSQAGMQGTPLQNVGSNFLAGSLGPYGNPYQMGTFGAAQQMLGGGYGNAMDYLNQWLEGQASGGGGGGGGGGGYHIAQPGGGSPYDTSALTEGIREEMLESYRRSIVPQIDAEYQRAGRYGSNAYATAQAMANEEINEAIGNQIADVMFQAHEGAANRANQLQMAGMSASSASAAAANQRDQMMLNAILGLGGLEQGYAGMGLGMMGDMSNLYGSYNLGLLGMIPGLEGISTDRMLGALGGYGDIARNQFNADMNQWQAARDVFNQRQQTPYNVLDQYAKYVLPLAEAFGTTSSSGYGQGPGVSRGGGIFSGLLSGLQTGAGIAGMLPQNMFGASTPPTGYGPSGTPLAPNMIPGRGGKWG